jgi:hypothetical protein
MASSSREYEMKTLFMNVRLDSGRQLRHVSVEVVEPQQIVGSQQR